MGITNLNRLIREHAPQSMEVMPVAELSMWRIGIDASMSIYQWCSIGKTRNIVNSRGEYINHVQGAFFRTLRMLTIGIYPVYVFDGKPPAMKDSVIAVRKAARDRGDAVRVPRAVFAEVSKLLDLMGVQTIQATSDAEATAAAMTIADQLDAVATEDTDALAFGALRIVSGLDATAKYVTVVHRDALLKQLGLDNNQFVDLCILLGCDYTGKLPGVGYKKSYDLIRKWGSIEGILANEKIGAPESFDYEGARRIFATRNVPTINIDQQPKQLSSLEVEALGEYLCARGLNASRMQKSMCKLREHYGIVSK